MWEQSEVVGLVDRTGNIVVEYKYDAWGKIIGRTGSLVSTLGYLNPFRYRGYVYDEETGLYYLRSRYYNPEWGRFINADVLLGKQGALLSHNLFAYCANNSVVYMDHSGHALVCCWGDMGIGNIIAHACSGGGGSTITSINSGLNSMNGWVSSGLTTSEEDPWTKFGKELKDTDWSGLIASFLASGASELGAGAGVGLIAWAFFAGGPLTAGIMIPAGFCIAMIGQTISMAIEADLEADARLGGDRNVVDQQALLNETTGKLFEAGISKVMGNLPWEKLSVVWECWTSVIAIIDNPIQGILDLLRSDLLN